MTNVAAVMSDSLPPVNWLRRKNSRTCDLGGTCCQTFAPIGQAWFGKVLAMGRESTVNQPGHHLVIIRINNAGYWYLAYSEKPKDHGSRR
jgi:hypothetical protein